MSQSSSAPSPVEVRLDRAEGRLEVLWEDDHRSSYRWRYLRGFCPCAECQGHAPRKWTFVDISEPRLSRIEEAGRYALNFIFEDGDDAKHDTGIYSYEILRRLCPCEACRAAEGQHHAVRQWPAEEPL